jgi:hypothetical protein
VKRAKRTTEKCGALCDDGVYGVISV